MKTASINNIQAGIDLLEVSLTDYKIRLKDSGHLLGAEIGAELEYTISSLLASINEILIDVKYLVRKNKIFIKLSTVDERNAIGSHIVNINANLNAFNWQATINNLDALKVIMRSYHISGDKEKFVEYSNAVDQLSKMSEKVDSQSQSMTEIVKKAKTNAEEVAADREQYEINHSNLIEKLQLLDSGITDVKQRYAELSGLVTNSEKFTKQIEQKLATATSSEQTIQTFAENVSNRENQLKDQQIKTDEYNKLLGSYKNKYNEILKEADDLIMSAREALKLSTAEGLSSAFAVQYDSANDPKKKYGWLVGSGVFLIFTIMLGAWVVGGWYIDDPENIRNILGRIALLPLSLMASLFCANQYVKLSNIAEDYAYKTVLAKSLVAFSEEIKQNDPQKYGEYISSVLDQIHQDPLRKRGKEDRDFGSNLNYLQRLLKELKHFTTD